MTPQEKAEQLVESFMNIKQQKLADYSIMYHPTAKQCALLAVKEIIKSIPQEPRSYTDTMLYWEEVKQEIGKL
jgi:hypothetical protein